MILFGDEVEVEVNIQATNRICPRRIGFPGWLVSSCQPLLDLCPNWPTLEPAPCHVGWS